MTVARKRTDSREVVRRVLQGYADRGIFREFGEAGSRGAKTEFRIRWLTDVPLRLIHDRKAETLSFRNLLPHVPARSAMYRELKAFLEGRASRSVPEHRRIDRRRAEVSCVNRKGNVSLSLKIKGRHHEYATRKAMNLVNEIFMSFLTGPYYDYMVQNFHISEE